MDDFLKLELSMILIVLIGLILYMYIFKRNNIYDYGEIKNIKCNKKEFRWYDCDADIDYNGMKRNIKFSTHKYWKDIFFSTPKKGDYIYISYDKNNIGELKHETYLTYYANKHKLPVLLISFGLLYYLHYRILKI